MKLSIIGVVGVPSRYGGFETLVENLLPLSGETIVYCSALSYSTREPSYKKANLVYLPLGANGIQSVLYDILAILHTLFRTKNDLLVLGVSGAIVFPIVKLFYSRRLVVNIDGLEWRRDKWGFVAKKYLKFSEWLSIKLSDVVIADNAAIARYVHDEYGASCKVIAYGGDHALISEVPDFSAGYALSLCRIEPENNVDVILEAFSRCAKQRIKFVGNWMSSQYGRSLRDKYCSFKNIDIIDPVYDIECLFKLRSECEFYVHGHSAGGTNPSLVEMMHFGKPILCFDCSYNRETTECEAKYFSSTADLEEILNECIFRECSGLKMKEIARRRYTWEIVKQQYCSAIE